jgi:hypothetical protein
MKTMENWSRKLNATGMELKDVVQPFQTNVLIKEFLQLAQEEDVVFMELFWAKQVDWFANGTENQNVQLSLLLDAKWFENLKFQDASERNVVKSAWLENKEPKNVNLLVNKNAENNITRNVLSSNQKDVNNWDVVVTCSMEKKLHLTATIIKKFAKERKPQNAQSFHWRIIVLKRDVVFTSLKMESEEQLNAKDLQKFAKNKQLSIVSMSKQIHTAQENSVVNTTDLKMLFQTWNVLTLELINARLEHIPNALIKRCSMDANKEFVANLQSKDLQLSAKFVNLAVLKFVNAQGKEFANQSRSMLIVQEQNVAKLKLVEIRKQFSNAKFQNQWNVPSRKLLNANWKQLTHTKEKLCAQERNVVSMESLQPRNLQFHANGLQKKLVLL